MTEEEKRLHRCCFLGQRPEKLGITEEEARALLGEEIDRAIAEGCTTFICGMSMGADLWAGEIVLEKREQNRELHLIAVMPYPGFAAHWHEAWRNTCERVRREADLSIDILKGYDRTAFRRRNEWLVDHASRMIVCIGGGSEDTEAMIGYAGEKGLTIRGRYPDPAAVPETEELPAEGDPAEETPDVGEAEFPVNILAHALPGQTFPEDIRLRLLIVMARSLRTDLMTVLEERYRDKEELQVIGERRGVTRERARRLVEKAENTIGCEQNIPFLLAREPGEDDRVRGLFEAVLDLIKKTECGGGRDRDPAAPHEADSKKGSDP